MNKPDSHSLLTPRGIPLCAAHWFWPFFYCQHARGTTSDPWIWTDTCLVRNELRQSMVRTLWLSLRENIESWILTQRSSRVNLRLLNQRWKRPPRTASAAKCRTPCEFGFFIKDFKTIIKLSSRGYRLCFSNFVFDSCRNAWGIQICAHKLVRILQTIRFLF